jgi:hypothetical protein
MNWREAVWQAVQREAARTRGVITRQKLLKNELANMRAATGSVGKTPDQTLSRELQELREAGLLLFDGKGVYRLSASSRAATSLDDALATEREALRKARVGQGKFRQGLLSRFGGRCPMTGIQDPKAVFASHIIPWAQCRSNAERLDPDNGLLLSALWDAAFDSYRVSFSEQGDVLVLANADGALVEQLRAAPNYVLPAHALTDAVQARLVEHRARAGAAALVRLHG